MTKPVTTVVLELDKRRDALWLGFVKRFAEVNLTESTDVAIASFPVRTYSLTDHQFIQIEVLVNTERGSTDASLLVPRNLVVTVIETKVPLDIKGFRFNAPSTVA